MEEVSYRRSVWTTSAITLIALAIFVAISAIMPRPTGRASLLVLGLFISVVPAVIWMAFFYQQDHTEREPKRLVVRMFVFGALGAAALATGLTEFVEGQMIAPIPSVVVRLLLTIFSVALLQETVKVAMVRYVVLGTNEFDRHPDGIVYGMASGLGFATVLTLAYVLQSGAVIPLAAAVRAADNVLVHGVLGAISGYYLGRVKIDGKGIGWMLRGLLIVTVINGAYQVISDELSNRLSFNPWYSLLVAAGLAVLAGVVLFAFFRRALARAVGDLSTISVQAHARSKDMPWDIKTRYDWLLIGAAALALVVGLGAGAVNAARSVAYASEEEGVEFRYPARWAAQSGGTGAFEVRNLSVADTFKPSISASSEKTDSGAGLDFLVADRLALAEQQRTYYREIAREFGLTVDGNEAIRSQYMYSVNTSAGPAVVRGTATYVLAGTRLYVFTFEAEPDAHEQLFQDYERLVRSVSFGTSQ